MSLYFSFFFYGEIARIFETRRGIQRAAGPCSSSYVHVLTMRSGARVHAHIITLERPRPFLPRLNPFRRVPAAQPVYAYLSRTTNVI